MPAQTRRQQADTDSRDNASSTRSPLTFFLLLFAFSLPFWLASPFVGYQLVPGVPVTALIVVFCPAAAAVILVYRQSKMAGVRDLLKRCFDYKRVEAKIWYAPMILLIPVVTILSYGWIRWMGVPVPGPQIRIVATLAMSLGIFILALGEELGWSAYAIDPMQDRLGALAASILLGLVWAIWHIVPLVQVHRPPAWIAWWCLGTVAARVLIVWLYNNTGKSVFAAAVLHATINVTWQLFPIRGSYWDPRVNGVILAIAAVVVTGVWGPRTLAGYTER